MSENWTKGPWRWHPTIDSKGWQGSVYAVELAGHAYAVAMAPKYQGADQWKFDAHLIASAPDLYEALKWYVEHDEGGESGGFYNQGRDRARAALSKARGEQP